MTGTALLTRFALRQDRGRLAIWALGFLLGAFVCAVNISTGFEYEAQRIASLEIAIESPALLIGRGLPMGTSAGSFLFYTYGVVLATVFGLFATFFAVRHGRADEDNGRREFLRAAATGRVSGLTAMLLSGIAAISVLAAAVALGLTVGGMDPAGSIWAGVVLGLVGWVFLGIGALCGQAVPTARAAIGAGVAVIATLFVVRVVADVHAEVDP